MDTAIGLAVGIGLSAACGFRVFVPALIWSLATHFGYVPAPSFFPWAGSTPAVIALSAATVVEILGYFIPWVDHALDVAAVPLATAAGTVLTASQLTPLGEHHAFLQWGLAFIAGGVTAGGTRATLAGVRGGLTATTGGIANPLLSIVELACATFAGVLAVVVPVLAIFLMLLAFGAIVRTARRFIARRKPVKLEPVG